mmetsp:Transcript_28129/g.71960  ORF Transcript_28129/g.71960 Transcript_28129/m.71960 type:complete len:434 (+) Transcript_28129:111-1412(+)
MQQMVVESTQHLAIGPKASGSSEAAHRMQAKFELALESMRVASKESQRALFEQRILLDRLFVRKDMRGAAHGLIVGTTKAISALQSKAQAFEVEALGLRSAMAQEQVCTLGDCRRTVEELHASYEASIASLAFDLSVAEVVDKAECERVKANLLASVEEERNAKARVAEKAAAQAAGHAVTIREMEEAMDKRRTQMHEDLEAMRIQLEHKERLRRMAVTDLEEAEQAHQLDLERAARETMVVVSALESERARADGYLQTIEDLKEAHEATMIQAIALERKIEYTERYTSHVQSVMAEKMDEMHKVQDWTLASTSARALEHSGYVHEQVLSHPVGTSPTRAPSVSQQHVRTAPRLSTPLGSARDASRSRIKLYAESRRFQDFDNEWRRSSSYPQLYASQSTQCIGTARGQVSRSQREPSVPRLTRNFYLPGQGG